jgi:hypothetical protein
MDGQNMFGTKIANGAEGVPSTFGIIQTYRSYSKTCDTSAKKQRHHREVHVQPIPQPIRATIVVHHKIHHSEKPVVTILRTKEHVKVHEHHKAQLTSQHITHHQQETVDTTLQQELRQQQHVSKPRTEAPIDPEQEEVQITIN